MLRHRFWSFISNRISVRYFPHDRRGSLATTFALSLIPATLLIGAAVDYGHVSSVRTQQQNALDAAVLAGAGVSDTTTRDQTALSAFLAENKGDEVVGGTPTFTTNADGTYSGSVRSTVPMHFVALAGISQLTYLNTSKATVAVGDISCILTLGKGLATSVNAMDFNGNPSINLSGCNLRSNASMTCNGNSVGSTQSLAVGTASGCTNPVNGAQPVPDIYASLSSKITLQCGSTHSSVTWTGGSSLPNVSQVIQVNKGTYTEFHVCGDLTLSGTGSLTGAAPTADQVVFVENGSITLANSANLSATRLTIVLTGSNSGSYTHAVNFPNGNGKTATFSISPSIDSSNPWHGISLYQDPNLTTNIDMTWGPGATFNADGVVYFPNANLTSHGNENSANSHCTKIVTNTFTSDGNVNLSFTQTSQACGAIGVNQYLWGARLVN